MVLVVAQATAKTIVPPQPHYVDKVQRLVDFVETEQLKNGEITVALEIEDAINRVAFIEEMLIGNPIRDAATPPYRPQGTIRLLGERTVTTEAYKEKI